LISAIGRSGRRPSQIPVAIGYPAIPGFVHSSLGCVVASASSRRRRPGDAAIRSQRAELNFGGRVEPGRGWPRPTTRLAGIDGRKRTMKIALLVLLGLLLGALGGAALGIGAGLA